MEFRRLQRAEIPLIWTIDRREWIGNIYQLEDGQLRLHRHNFDVPGWPPGTEEKQTPLLYGSFDRGGPFFAAFDGPQLAGVAVLDTVWRGSAGDLLQLLFLHVGRDYRDKGVGGHLIEQARTAARELGARGLYISATPSEHTVRFYQGHGASLLESPDPDLFALEPEDIHLECPV